MKEILRKEMCITLDKYPCLLSSLLSVSWAVNIFLSVLTCMIAAMLVSQSVQLALTAFL